MAIDTSKDISEIYYNDRLLEGDYRSTLNDLMDNRTSFTTFKFPKNIYRIPDYFFVNCNSLAIDTLPDSIGWVGYNAFNSCFGLTTMTFTSTPLFIGVNAFQNCPNLTTINVPWAEGAVDNAPWGATDATINYNYSPTPTE